MSRQSPRSLPNGEKSVDPHGRGSTHECLVCKHPCVGGEGARDEGRGTLQRLKCGGSQGRLKAMKQ